jgi:nucleotide-binding universal stress UspA family protein
MASDTAGEPAAPPFSLTVAPGQLIDGFRVEEHLHQGGMAQLWRVTRVADADAPEPMPLIMKVPRIKGGEDPATIVGFEVEQMVLPMLKGPHVPKFVAKGDFTRQPYIVMERIPGESLRPMLDAAPLPPEQVADLGARVALALHDLHRQHLVHLDIKPSNILFRPSGEAVLCDFGLARHDQLPDLLEEEFPLPMGTGPYMSPEQVQFVRNDPRSDLFALGVLLYHLATGQRPFGAPTSVRGLRQRLYQEPVPPRRHQPGCPPWLQEVILHCLEVNPDKRYQSASLLAVDLQNPQQVVLTKRAQRMEAPSRVRAFRRWFAALGAEPEGPGDARAQALKHPIVLVAVDLTARPALLQELRDTVQRLMATAGGARLACASVMRTARIGMDELVDEQGQSLHVKQLVGLKHWAHPIVQHNALDEARVTFHVLEAPDPAAALLEFARRNEVDHIVMGARGHSALRRYLGSVSSQVVAESPCTVTVVKALEDE